MTSDRRSLLREGYEMGTATLLIFGALLTGIMVVTFWGPSPGTRLLIWGAAALGHTASLYSLRRRNLDQDRWFKWELAAQVTSGLCWGSIAVVAMPNDRVYQAVLIAIMSVLAIASSSSGESQIRSLHLGYLLALSAVVSFGFFVHPGGLRLAGLLFILSAAFALAISGESRAAYHRAVDLRIENEKLVEQLAADRDTLTIANERLDRLAWTDALTGLANRAGINRTLEQMLGSLFDEPNSVTVAYLDLDGFKPINDTYGHRTGDMLLAAVAKRLVAVAHPEELPGRLGGDELTMIGSQTDLEAMGERLAALFDAPFRIDGHVLRISCGIGLATTTEPCAPDELLRRADQALYANKNATDGRYCLYSSDTQTQRTKQAHVPEALPVSAVAHHSGPEE